MTTNAKTFRLFISSTFNDFKVERQILHEKVFPEINKYLLNNYPEYTFQPVDLRWGVSEEAQLDQKTLDLCLNEVRACKDYLHPNFLVMLGNRYGWVGVPSSIEEKEFKSLYQYVKTHHADKITYLDYWYRLENNVVPPAYVLWERSDERANKDIEKKFGKEFQKDFATLDAPDDKEKKEWNSAWSEHEGILRYLLQEAVQETMNKSDGRYSKYFLSATEAEVEEGILKYIGLTPAQRASIEKEKNETLPELDAEYVYAWIRDISNAKTVNQSEAPGKFYLDKGAKKEEDNLLPESRDFREKVTAILKPLHNFKASSVALNNDPDQPITDEDYLRKFEICMVKKLKGAIYKQIKKAKKLSQVDEKLIEELKIPSERYLALKQERSEQLRFKSLKTETFFGRDKELKVVQDYINNTTTQPFMVHGISGIGKSSFIAKVIDQTKKHNVAYRFIGTTASSTNIRTLLESLIIDLADKGVLKLPEIFEEDNNKFNVQIKELLSNIEQPTVIFLDALDQLQHKDYLQWLPMKLPENLKVILSMLDQEGYEHYYKLLGKKIDQINQCEILPLDEKAGCETLEKLLEKEDRSLTKKQFEYVIEQYKKSDSSPLYLKIAFEEVKMWKSTETTETLRVGIQKIIKEFIDNLTDKFHHDRTIVHKVLGLISASRDGLSEKEILDLLSRDEDILNSLEKFTDLTLEIDEEKVRRFPISVWARLSEQLRPFLNEKLVDGQNLITFFHRQIEEAVRDYIYEPNKDILHKELAAYFLTLQNKEETWDKRYYNPHMLDEVPYQLFHANDAQYTEKLKEILFDLEFAGSIYDRYKQNRFREIMEKAKELEGITSVEMYPWESFYREKEHLIRKVDEAMWRPHQSLFQLAYEDGNNSPISQEVERLLQNNRVDFLWLKKKNRNQAYKRSGLLKVLQGHSYETTIKGVEVMNNGRILSYDYTTLRLWSREGEALAMLEGHTKEIKGVEILEDGRILSYQGSELSEEEDNRLILWSSEGEELAVLKEKHTKEIKGVEILEDGRILSYSSDSLRLWSSEGAYLGRLEDPYDRIIDVKILNDGRILSHSVSEVGFCDDSLDDENFEYENNLRILSSEGEAIDLLEGQTHEIDVVEILDDGKILSSYFNGLCLWSSEGEELAVMEEHNVDGVKILDNGRILSHSGSPGSGDYTLRLWSSEGEELALLDKHTTYIDNYFDRVKILDEGRFLYYSEDGTLRLCSSEGEELASWEGRIQYIDGVKILDDGRILLHSGNKLHLWSSEGKELAVMEGHTNYIKGVEILDDGRILSYSNDNIIRLWSSEGEALAEFEGQNSFLNFRAMILDNGRILSYASNELRLWSSEDEELYLLEGHTKNIEGHTKYIDGVKILDDGRILSYSKDGTLRLWSSEGEELALLDKHTTYIYNYFDRVKILDDGRILLHSGNKLHLWSSQGKPLAALERHKGAIVGAKILEDSRILSYSEDGTLRLWSSEGKELAFLKGHSGSIERVKILDDGRILSMSKDELWLWSSEGKDLGKLKWITKNIRCVRGLDDGNILFSSFAMLFLWSIEGESFIEFDGHHIDAIKGVEILDNGRILSYPTYSDDNPLRPYSSDSEENTLLLWSSEGEKLASLGGHTGEIVGAKILEDSRILSYSRHELLLWSSEGKKLAETEGHTDYIKGVEILDDGRILFHSGNKLHLWSSEGEELAVMEGHTDYIDGVEILDDGRILSYSNDNTIRLWSSEGSHLNVLPTASEGIMFSYIKQETIVAKNAKDLLLYDYYDGNEATTLEGIAQKSEALLHTDGR